LEHLLIIRIKYTPSIQQLFVVVHVQLERQTPSTNNVADTYLTTLTHASNLPRAWKLTTLTTCPKCLTS